MKLKTWTGINAFHFVQTLTVGAGHKLDCKKAAYNMCVLVYQTTNLQRNHISDMEKILEILQTEMGVKRCHINAKKVGIDLDVGLKVAVQEVGFESRFDVMHLYRTWYAKLPSYMEQ